jgi:hypothetical protein
LDAVSYMDPVILIFFYSKKYEKFLKIHFEFLINGVNII